MMESNSISVNATTGSVTTNATTSDSKSELDQEDFMLLLLAQLKNQNPLEPMSDQEFMSQMTQLNSLNALKSIDSKIETITYDAQLSNAAAMIGKTVDYVYGDSEADITSGVVSAVSVKNGEVFLMVGEATVALSDVRRVATAA